MRTIDVIGSASARRNSVNEWANFHANDFAPVVAAFKELVEQFYCNDYHAILSVAPEYGAAESVRCACGKVSVYLVKKG